MLSAYARLTDMSVVLKLISDVEEFRMEFEGRKGVDTTFVLPVKKAVVD